MEKAFLIAGLTLTFVGALVPLFAAFMNRAYTMAELSGRGRRTGAVWTFALIGAGTALQIVGVALS